MGDAENALPHSKKRAAGRELSRDNPGLDDEEEVCDQEAGTFKRASEEVLANRKIVKVRRNRTSSAPSSNPFAAICLVPPTDSAATPVTVPNVQETVKTASEVVESQVMQKRKLERKKMMVINNVKSRLMRPRPGQARPNTDEEKHEVASDVRKSESADAEAAKERESNGVENEEKENCVSVSSFQQLSSSENAFTGLVGTGFSSSTFSFGSITKTDQPTCPSFSLGTNGNSSLFGNSGAPVCDKTEGRKIPSIQEVQVETGEENEAAVFTADSVLFEFLDGGWKERGKGELKVNISTTGTQKARLVMRAKGNYSYRLILNASLFPDMKLMNMEKKGITFACLNSTGEGKDSLSTFALKFKDASVVEEFRAMVTQHKGNTPVASLKILQKHQMNSTCSQVSTCPIAFEGINSVQ